MIPDRWAIKMVEGVSIFVLDPHHQFHVVVSQRRDPPLCPSSAIWDGAWARLFRNAAGEGTQAKPRKHGGK